MGRRRAAQAVDLYDYVPQASSDVRASIPLGDRGANRQPVIRVQDDWPDVVPITEAELRVVEGHFGDVLDALFGPKS